MSDIEGRVKSLESWRAELTTIQAVDAEKRRHIDSRFDKLDGHIAKLVWLVLAGIITAFMAFVVKGGLNVG